VIILVVADSESIHTARWIAQVADRGWEIHLFPSVDHGLVCPELKGVHIHHTIYGNRRGVFPTVKVHGIPLGWRRGSSWAIRMLRKLSPEYRAMALARLVRRLKPQVVHSLEIQASGYLTLEAKKKIGDDFPPWIVTNWGSDIYLFGRLPDHARRIREVLAACDYYSCECPRDVILAREFGFKGSVLPVIPNAGGFDLKEAAVLRQAGPASARRVVIVKGYQGWAGRALVALRSLRRCVDLLSGYEVVLYSASEEVILAARLFEADTGVKITVLPSGTPYKEMLAWRGRARVSIGLSISDGISTSLLEAIAMGSLPVQSNTACTEGWIKHGVNGMVVPPEDPEVVESALRRALTDDAFVDLAAEINYRLAAAKLDSRALQPKAVGFYEQAARGGEGAPSCLDTEDRRR
jgi:glycosyltransferase involved in cell wall biosynthesis